MNTQANSARLELRLHSPRSLLALTEGEEAFQRDFGLRASEGLRSFFASGDISPLWLAQLREARQPDPWRFGFAVIDRASSLVIGTAGFKGPPNDQGSAEVAYAIVPAFEGKGYATEALGGLVRFAFKDERVHSLYAHTLPENNASTRVLTKNGFTKLGEVMDPDDGRVWRWERTKAATSP